ncbi:hypothetical protein C3Y08_12050 [Burkholderia gladioli]|nr:hypothetical protein C3Y08_12050 [Burkholderia gladioli]
MLQRSTVKQECSTGRRGTILRRKRKDGSIGYVAQIRLKDKGKVARIETRTLSCAARTISSLPGRSTCSQSVRFLTMLTRYQLPRSRLFLDTWSDIRPMTRGNASS